MPLLPTPYLNTRVLATTVFGVGLWLGSNLTAVIVQELELQHKPVPYQRAEVHQNPHQLATKLTQTWWKNIKQRHWEQVSHQIAECFQGIQNLHGHPSALSQAEYVKWLSHLKNVRFFAKNIKGKLADSGKVLTVTYQLHLRAKVKTDRSPEPLDARAVYLEVWKHGGNKRWKLCSSTALRDSH